MLRVWALGEPLLVPTLTGHHDPRRPILAAYFLLVMAVVAVVVGDGLARNRKRPSETMRSGQRKGVVVLHRGGMGISRMRPTGDSARFRAWVEGGWRWERWQPSNQPPYDPTPVKVCKKRAPFCSGGVKRK